MPRLLLSAKYGPKDLILLATTGMEKYMSEASVFVPKSMSEASPIFSKINERSELISISNKIEKQSKWPSAACPLPSSVCGPKYLI